MHINAGSEQNTKSIRKLLKSINSTPECVKEFGRWGLEISTEMLLVRFFFLVPATKAKYIFFQHEPIQAQPLPSTFECSLNCFLASQMKGRTLLQENICMKSSSFAAGIDARWSTKVVRDACISSVSANRKWWRVDVMLALICLCKMSFYSRIIYMTIAPLTDLNDLFGC